MPDQFVAAYMDACKSQAPDHNEIGLHFFKAAWGARDAEIEHLKTSAHRFIDEIAERDRKIESMSRRLSAAELERNSAVDRARMQAEIAARATDELVENEGVINVWRRRSTKAETETEALRAAIRGALSTLGTGHCNLCQCDGCEFEHADAVRELTDALRETNDE